MNLKCGVDIIEVERIKNAIERNEGFLRKVFTQKEIEYCDSKNIMKFQHYAVRYAAKEAVFKAISELLDNKYDIKWTDIEILNNENGKPYVIVYNDKIKNIKIDISLSHIKTHAIANCVCYI